MITPREHSKDNSTLRKLQTAFPVFDSLLNALTSRDILSLASATDVNLSSGQYDKHILGLGEKERKKFGLLKSNPSTSIPGSAWESELGNNSESGTHSKQKSEFESIPELPHESVDDPNSHGMLQQNEFHLQHVYQWIPLDGGSALGLGNEDYFKVWDERTKQLAIYAEMVHDNLRGEENEEALTKQLEVLKSSSHYNGEWYGAQC
jgi:hypothetical protein